MLEKMVADHRIFARIASIKKHLDGKKSPMMTKWKKEHTGENLDKKYLHATNNE